MEYWRISPAAVAGAAPRVSIRDRCSTLRGGAVRLHYDPQTDALYVELDESPAFDSREVGPDLVADFGDDGRLVGLDIQHARKRLGPLLELQSAPRSGDSPPHMGAELQNVRTYHARNGPPQVAAFLEKSSLLAESTFAKSKGRTDLKAAVARQVREMARFG